MNFSGCLLYDVPRLEKYGCLNVLASPLEDHGEQSYSASCVMPIDELKFKLDLLPSKEELIMS